MASTDKSGSGSGSGSSKSSGKQGGASNREPVSKKEIQQATVGTGGKGSKQSGKNKVKPEGGLER